MAIFIIDIIHQQIKYKRSLLIQLASEMFHAVPEGVRKKKKAEYCEDVCSIFYTCLQLL